MWCNKCKQDLNEQLFTPTMRACIRDGSRWCNVCKSANRNYAREYQKALNSGKRAREGKERREYARKQRKLRPWLKRHSESMRRARKIRAMPPWVTTEMKKQMRDFYRNCPEGYEVDHIYPLAGKNSCGLHVPWNLQYLPQHENRTKYNKEPE